MILLQACQNETSQHTINVQATEQEKLIINKLQKAGLQAFSSDGCSMFVEGSLKQPKLWCKCCLEHDLAYWQGGSEQQRLAADQQFKHCVYQQTNNKLLAQSMYQGVRLGGKPSLPTSYRWGYGWTELSSDKKRLPYQSLSTQQLTLIGQYLQISNDYQQQLKQHCSDN